MLVAEIVIGLIISTVCAYFAYKVAESKGRQPVLWAVLGFVFPFLGLLVVALLGPAQTRTPTPSV
jgi:hypothetical protein